ncbi:OmpA-like domain-containing protein [Vibrio crassostreae]|uniref:OmpA-like domain-containing protein n=2 Tax=Vibrio TaxID=662 RepID=A0A822MQ94_9VIBR|nr:MULTISPECIES: OmpA family protein [Vibrio]MDH5923925.1 OmpA family protein [Vibrio splendidus]TCL18132.1 OmpA family protein [Vibrio crassostreae]TCN00136.1 OmpA family protein [Vibrio crassostreae]TCT41962.1 OmpA family protein [Vibrio crassostreae]TCT45656.1 OmpA family protein [Vibrio crassostreae]
MNIKKILIFSTFLIIISCANTETNEYTIKSINQEARLADQDGDGVINIRDACPDTELDIIINNNGCAVIKSVEEVKEIIIFFKIGSAKIEGWYANELEEYSNYIENHDDSTIFIEGHTSEIGSNEVNEKLQLQRANAVKDALVYYGANPDNIEIVNQGQHTKSVNNKHDASDAVNQRVYVKIIKLKNEDISKWKINDNN